MNNKRYFHIDFLRAAAILGVIVVHVWQYNLRDFSAKLIWNYGHFVVPAFVFCSGYVLQKHNYNFNNLKEVLIWFKKRMIRLLIPFYTYLLIHYLLIIFFPQFFSGLGLIKSFQYIINSIFLTGGVESGWLPLLFIELTLIFPILKIINKKTSTMFIYFLFAVLMTGLFTFATLSKISLYQYYRALMIVPYSLILILSMKLAGAETTEPKIRNYLITALIGLITIVLLLVGWPVLGRTTLIGQKYPPNLYYLSYGLVALSIVIIMSTIKWFQQGIINRFILFTSKESYSLFFISYIVLDLIQKQRAVYQLMNNTIIQFLLTILMSYLVIYVLNFLKAPVYQRD